MWAACSLGFEEKKICNTRGLTQWGQCVSKLPQHILCLFARTTFFFLCKMGTLPPFPPPLPHQPPYPPLFFIKSFFAKMLLHHAKFILVFFHVRARTSCDCAAGAEGEGLRSACSLCFFFSFFFWSQRGGKKGFGEKGAVGWPRDSAPTCLNVCE